MLKRILFFFFCCFPFLTFSANAQFFTDEVKEAESVDVVQQKVQQKADSVNDSSTQPLIDKEKTDNIENLSPFEYDKFDLNAEKSGSDTIYPVIALDEKNNRVYREEIILTMKNFNVYRTASGQIRCSMRFSALSTYKEKISNVSYQLKWPNMSTMLSFDNIKPNIEYYMDYLLIGEGCYTMDKIPNIIVNRCRVKGKSQKECAASVHWATRGV